MADSDYVQEAVAAAIADIERIGSGVPVVLPELVNEGEWNVLPADNLQGRTALEDKTMFVPFDNGDEEAAIRLHELGHAKWTPLESTAHLKELTDYLQVVEDMRIHHLLSESVGHWDIYGNEIVRSVRQGYADGRYPLDIRNATLLEIAARQSNGEQVLPDLIDEAKKLVDLVQSEIKADPSPETSLRMARYVRDIMEGEGEDDGSSPTGIPVGDSPDTEGGDGESGSGESGNSDTDSEGIDGDTDGEPTDSPSPLSKPKDGMPRPTLPSLFPVTTEPIYTASGATWAPMETQQPALTRAVDKSKVTRRTKKAMVEGTVPRRIHRMTTDGKIFTRKAKRLRPGGAVLLDASGSMGLSDASLDELVLKTKHGTVAAYKGTSDGENGAHGWLVILADKWMRVDSVDVMPYGGCNLVDGPAIRWLCAQPEPRVWISDGEVTGMPRRGCGEDYDSDLRAEVDALCKKFKIVRYDSIGDYLRENEA
jgi:hypothetical protein